MCVCVYVGLYNPQSLVKVALHQDESQTLQCLSFSPFCEREDRCALIWTECFSCVSPHVFTGCWWEDALLVSTWTHDSSSQNSSLIAGPAPSLNSGTKSHTHNVSISLKTQVVKFPNFADVGGWWVTGAEVKNCPAESTRSSVVAGSSIATRAEVYQEVNLGNNIIEAIVLGSICKTTSVLCTWWITSVADRTLAASNHGSIPSE